MATQSAILYLPCSQCGGQVGYSAEKKQLICTHCAHSESIDTSHDRVIEQSLAQIVQQAASWQIPISTAKKVLSCKSCGAENIVDADVATINCSFCGSRKVDLAAFDKKLIQPVGIIPFLIPRKTAEKLFSTWIGTGWFRPNALKKAAELQTLHGVYIPFWTYDAQTTTQYEGEVGYHYYVTQYITDSNGNRQAVQVQHTRWEWKSGQFSHWFDDVLVVASKGISQQRMEDIYPFNLEALINYDPRLLLNWEAEVYTIEVDKGYTMASGIMDKRLYEMSAARLGGDTYRNLSLNTQKTSQTFKHIILPVWIAAYQYNNQTYQFAINAQTGRVSGEKPYSWIKIFFACLFAVGIIALIYYISENNQ